MLENILDKLKAHSELFKETAFIVTTDEGGSYWDSGIYQPLDFFGDGPRIPLVVVSPFSHGGKVNNDMPPSLSSSRATGT
jgi:phospholipase C